MGTKELQCRAGTGGCGGETGQQQPEARLGRAPPDPPLQKNFVCSYEKTLPVWAAGDIFMAVGWQSPACTR